MEVQSVSSAAPTVAQTRSASESASAGKVSQLITQKKGGTPPAGGGAKLAAASTSSNSISSTAKALYDKRDADQDDTVSYQEDLLYALKNPSEETQSQITVSASQIKAGLQAYQQSE